MSDAGWRRVVNGAADFCGTIYFILASVRRKCFTDGPGAVLSIGGNPCLGSLLS